MDLQQGDLGSRLRKHDVDAPSWGRETRRGSRTGEGSQEGCVGAGANENPSPPANTFGDKSVLFGPE